MYIHTHTHIHIYIICISEVPMEATTDSPFQGSETIPGRFVFPRHGWYHLWSKHLEVRSVPSWTPLIRAGWWFQTIPSIFLSPSPSPRVQPGLKASHWPNAQD